MAEFVPVMRTPELGPGEIREVRAHGRTLALVNVGQTYYALDAFCPNEGANLATEGRLVGDLITCPRDGSTFDVRTGRRVGQDDGDALGRYAIRVAENAILVGPRIRERRDAA